PEYWRVRVPKRERMDPYRRHTWPDATTKHRVRLSTAKRPTDRHRGLWLGQDTVQWKPHRRRRQRPAVGRRVICLTLFRWPTPRDGPGRHGLAQLPGVQTVALHRLNQPQR